MSGTRYLAHILMIISRVLLQQKELIPHPPTFGALKNPPSVALRHPKQFPNIPRRERHGGAGPQHGERQQEQHLIGYHCIQSVAKCPGWLANYGNRLLIGWTLEGSVIRTDIVFLCVWCRPDPCERKTQGFNPAECETLVAYVTGTGSRSGTKQSVTPTLFFGVKTGLEVKIYCVIYVLDLAFFKRKVSGVQSKSIKYDKISKKNPKKTSDIKTRLCFMGL